MNVLIKPAYEELDKVRQLFDEYTTMLGINLDFQNYSAEYANLPGKYAAPEGGLYIAMYNDQLAGCVAFRKYNNELCEMKRLYVRPEYRGLKIGRALVEKVILEARKIHYKSIILDTSLDLKNSIRLYKKIGFYEIEPYYNNPYPDVIYLKLDLIY